MTVFPVPEISDVELAFPATALDWMPEWDAIPAEFKDGRTEWNKIALQWFRYGLPAEVEFYPYVGVDPEKAVRAIQATLGSYAPKHQHKEAAVAFMLSEWFGKIEKWRK